MNASEADTIAALTTLFSEVKKLQELNIRDLLLPDNYAGYRASLDAVFDSRIVDHFPKNAKCSS